jgi:hypothetical protein
VDGRVVTSHRCCNAVLLVGQIWVFRWEEMYLLYLIQMLYSWLDRYESPGGKGAGYLIQMLYSWLDRYESPCGKGSG